MKRDLFAAVTAAGLLAACTSTPDPEVEIRTIEVPVPVAVECVPENMPGAPRFTVTRETLLEAPDAAERFRQAVVGMLERDARLMEVEPVVAGCRREPAQ